MQHHPVKAMAKIFNIGALGAGNAGLIRNIDRHQHNTLMQYFIMLEIMQQGAWQTFSRACLKTAVPGTRVARPLARPAINCLTGSGSRRLAAVISSRPCFQYGRHRLAAEIMMQQTCRSRGAFQRIDPGSTRGEQSICKLGGLWLPRSFASNISCSSRSSRRLRGKPSRRRFSPCSSAAT